MGFEPGSKVMVTWWSRRVASRTEGQEWRGAASAAEKQWCRSTEVIDQMEATVGLYGVLPRMRRPERPTINAAGMTFNNINVNDSVVGVINTGIVEKLDVAVDAVRDDGQGQLADILQKIAQAVVDAPDLTAPQKDEAVEHLAFLAEQAALPKEQRQRSVGKTVITGLERVVNAAASVSTLWPAVVPLLLSLFQ